MWREGFLTGGGTRFHVRALGHGDDVALLLHGWPGDGTVWRDVAPPLVAAGWRVVCPDLKGFGRSDTPTSGYDPETLADEISQLIRNLHVRRAVLVGHDLGGAVALATAFRHPGRVRALVVCASPYRQLDLRRAWPVPLMNLPFAPETAFRLAARRLVRAVLEHGTASSDPWDDDVVAAYAASVSARPAAWLSYYRTLSRHAILDAALRTVRRRIRVIGAPLPPPHLRVPALVVWGEDDPASPARLAPAVARDLHAGLVTLPGVGHFVPEEAPDALADAILGLIGEGGSANGETSTGA